MKKEYKILIFIGVLYLIGMGIYFLTKKDNLDDTNKNNTNIENKEDEIYTYLIIGNDTIARYENGEFIRATTNDVREADYFYNIYDALGNYINNANLKYYEKSWYAYDFNREPVTVPNRYLLAVSNAPEFTITRFNKTTTFDENDEENIIKILDERNIDLPAETMNKTVVDLDSDGKNEIIYELTNIGLTEADYYYSLIAVTDEFGNHVLENRRGNKVIDVLKFNLIYLIDIDGDKNLEIILHADTVEAGSPCDSIHQKDEDEYIRLLRCKY